MSIFDTVTKHTSKRKISHNFLKKHGFYVDRWSGPRDRQQPSSVFYEALICGYDGILKTDCDPYSITASIKYFPEDFDKYTNFNTNRNIADQDGTGFGVVAGKLVITYEHSYWSDKVMGKGIYKDTMIFNCKTHEDFYNAIEIFNIDLKEKDYEPIRY